jgi:hypothetical protein
LDPTEASARKTVERVFEMSMGQVATVLAKLTQLAELLF